MEQYYPHYQMMWMNKKHLPKLHFHQSPAIDKPSWEEKAFADDAAGLLGAGFMWPPRCYSCSFCRRDFRSAQALGGHMNVHRRERAKLKQSLTNRKNPTTTTTSTSTNANPNPNANPSMVADALVPSPSLSRVSSTISTQENSTSHHEAANVDTKLSMGLSLAVSQSESSSDVIISLKPQKFSHVSERPSSSIEDVDLELRLGLPHH